MLRSRFLTLFPFRFSFFVSHLLLCVRCVGTMKELMGGSCKV